jgi:hypothetical protein
VEIIMAAKEKTDADRFIDRMMMAKRQVDDPATRLIMDEAMEFIGNQEEHIGTLRELKDLYSIDLTRWRRAKLEGISFADTAPPSVKEGS